MISMLVKNKKTGALWEVPGGSPAAIRIKASPNDYEIMTDEPPKKKKGVHE